MAFRHGKRGGIRLNNPFKPFFSNPWVEIVCRWSLGALFVAASYNKILEPAQFAKVLYGYQLLPGILINFIAIILPFMELVTGAALVTGIYPRSAAAIINIMMLIFIVAISINLLRGHAFDCGCFSISEANHPSSAATLLVRDVVCLFAGCIVMQHSGKRKFCFIA